MQDVNEKMIKYKVKYNKIIDQQHDIEKKLRIEMESEVKRIREFEMSAIRLEEAENQRVYMEKYRGDLERQY